MQTAPNVDPNDALMLRFQRGDVGAFEALVDAWKQPVLNFVARTIRDQDEAEDIAQNVFVQVYRVRDRYESTGRFAAWLFTIARNFCLNELRRRARHPADPLDAPVSESDPQLAHEFPDRSMRPPDAVALVDELELKVEEALAALPEAQRTALLLFQRDDMAYEDIAGVLGVSLSATKSLIHRARETVKQRLKPYLQTGEWHAAER